MTINISLPPELEDMVHAKVEAGLYNSPGEMISVALHVLDDRDQFRQMKLEKLRTEIQKGVDSGPGIPADEVFRQVHAAIDAVAESRKKENADLDA